MKEYILLIPLLFYVNPLYSQNKMIEGRIIDRSFESIINVSIFYNDSICVGKSELSGIFQIEVPLLINKVSFSAPGWEQADVELSDGCNFVELIMIEDANYDMSPQKADKVRRKEYKKLTKLHKEAYRKGIFQSSEICYKRKFSEFSK